MAKDGGKENKLQALTKKDYFGDHIPTQLPADAETPGFEELAVQASSWDTAGYPLDSLLPILISENSRLGVSESVINRLASCTEPPLFILAGQQAGLFGGPLYTLYKALHAIRLAARLEKAAHRPILPLFWVASDDHDAAEVSKLVLRTDNGSFESVTCLPSTYRENMPVGTMVLDDGILPAIDILAKHLPPGPAGERYKALIRDSWRPGSSWTDAFIRQYAAFLGESGLLFIDPRWPGIKPLFAPVMRKELMNPLASTALVNEQADNFETIHDRRHALRRPPDAANLFLETGGSRQRIHYQNGMFITDTRSYSAQEMLSLLDQFPERFSPGAALRPVCQDMIMPVPATIAGPGERRYLSQTSPVYSFFGVIQSHPWPRASFTVVDRRTARYASQDNFAPAQLFGDADKILAGLARESLPEEIASPLAALESSVEGHFDSLEHALGSLDRTLVESAGKDRGRILHILADIRDRAVRAQKSTLGQSERRIRAASTFLLPGGDPQERRFGIDAILPVIDEAGLNTFIELTSPGEEAHRIVFPE